MAKKYRGQSSLFLITHTKQQNHLEYHQIALIIDKIYQFKVSKYMGMVVGIALIWFIIEMLVWYLISQVINGGGWLVFGWFIVAAVIGIGLIKKTARTLNPMAQQMKSGVIPNPANQPPESTITKSVAMGIAGLLLFLPGILTDVMAFALLLPFVQKTLVNKAKTYAMNNQEKMMKIMAQQMGGNSPFGNMGGGFGGTQGGSPFGNSPFGNNPFGGNSPFGTKGTVVDGEAKTVSKNIKQIKSANDE